MSTTAVAPVAFVTPTRAPRWKRWCVYSPLARIVIFTLVAALVMGLFRFVMWKLGYIAKDGPAIPRRVGIVTMQLLPLVVYLFLVWRVERRRAAELAWHKIVPHSLAGAAFGLALISSVVGALWLVGGYQVTGTNPDANWVPALLTGAIGAAIAEEIIFRGVLFRITEEGLGTWPAIAISAALFGGLHIFNAGATWWSSTAIAIEAGVLLGLVYHVWRSLPLCMGLHAAWNFVQGTVFGVPVSGTGDPGWLESVRPGPDWLTGGAFGIEASVVAVGLSLLASIALATRARRSGSIVERSWRNARIIEAPSSQAAPC